MAMRQSKSGKSASFSKSRKSHRAASDINATARDNVSGAPSRGLKCRGPWHSRSMWQASAGVLLLTATP